MPSGDWSRCRCVMEPFEKAVFGPKPRVACGRGRRRRRRRGVEGGGRGAGAEKCGEGGDGGVLEEGGDGDLAAQGADEAGVDLDELEGGAADVEEVVVEAGEGEERTWDQRVARVCFEVGGRDEGTEGTSGGTGGTGRRARSTLPFSVRGREVEGGEEGGDHVVREGWRRASRRAAGSAGPVW